MHDDDEITGPGRERFRRPSSLRRTGLTRRSHPQSHRPGTTTIVISVACPTPGCAGRLHFGPTGNDEGLTSTCATCRQPFVLTAGDVELRSTHDTASQDGAG